MSELPLAPIADLNFMGIEYAGSITGEEYFLLVRGEGLSGDLCRAHKLRTCILCRGVHGLPVYSIADWSSFLIGTGARSGISDGNDRPIACIRRQHRHSQQIIIRTGYALRAR
jgi:hypothetical protein